MITSRPSVARHRRFSGEVVAGDHVENDVDAAPAGEGVDALDEVLVAVVDGRVGSEPGRSDRLSPATPR